MRDIPEFIRPKFNDLVREHGEKAERYPNTPELYEHHGQYFDHHVQFAFDVSCDIATVLVKRINELEKLLEDCNSVLSLDKDSRIENNSGFHRAIKDILKKGL